MVSLRALPIRGYRGNTPFGCFHQNLLCNSLGATTNNFNEFMAVKLLLSLDKEK
jgi:hypothetical protein